MTPAARVQAAIEVLDQVLSGMAAEAALTSWARRSRFAGSKDRHAVRDHVFDALRTKRSSAIKGGSMSGRGLMIGFLADDLDELENLFSGVGHGPAILSDQEREVVQNAREMSAGEAADLPDWILPEFQRSVGDDLSKIGKLFQKRAPVYLRVNPKKATRESVLAMLVDRNIPATPDGLSPTAIRIDASPRGLRNLELFLAGHFEFQDGGSQAVIDELGDLTGKSVLDYCAGGGGKSLALAALGSKVTACDLYPARMKELPERAKRAGVSIGTSNIDDVAKNAPYDVVLCDVPCSGSGAWRRQPDAKWNLTQERLDELGATQLDVLSRVASMVAPKGILAYVTCSLLKCENEDVVGSFVQANKDWSVLRHRQISPIGPCTLEGGKNGKILGWHDLS